jgi:hypothetical protein
VTQEQQNWQEMISEFAALGGIADNVCLRQGRYGRGLFPIDRSKPIRVCIPERLLLPLEYVGFIDNQFRVSPQAAIGNRERAFLENYERDFSWGASRNHAEELLGMLAEAPANLRELLEIPFGLEPWLAGPTPRAIQERFLYSRVIKFKDKMVVMPIIELANHGHATTYQPEQDRLELSGTFEDEVLVRYTISDPLGIFAQWGFVTGTEPFALSVPVRLDRKAGALVVERNLEKFGELVSTDDAGKPPFVPEVSVEGGTVKLSHMLLGHKNFPRIARGIFYTAMRKAGIQDPAEPFDLIQHINRTLLYRLLELSEGAAPPLATLLRTVARYQLECASNNVGIREL